MMIKLAWRNVWRNWRRTLIAATAIVLGLILLLLWSGILGGFEDAIYGNAIRMYGGNIQVHAPGFRDKATRMPLLPLADGAQVLATITGHPEVVAATRRINTGGLVTTGGGSYPVMITGIEPAGEAPVSLVAENISDGRFLSPQDGDAVLIGRELADLLEVGVGERITVLGRRINDDMRQRNMTVIGIYDLGLGEAEKGTVFINLPLAQTLYNLRGQETEVTVMLQQVGDESVLLEELQMQLPGYEVDSWLTLRPEIASTMALEQQVIGVFGVVLMLIASIGILNLMMMAVYERTREMGVLTALGMKGREVMSMFVLEGAMIGAIGAAIGSVLGWTAVQAIIRAGGIDLVGLYGEDYLDTYGGELVALMGSVLMPQLGLSTVLGWSVAVILIAALASLLPAWQASRREPAEALHHV
jgi:ABC-type lipoprotein release transport system permease subunit